MVAEGFEIFTEGIEWRCSPFSSSIVTLGEMMYAQNTGCFLLSVMCSAHFCIIFSVLGVFEQISQVIHEYALNKTNSIPTFWAIPSRNSYILYSVYLGL